MYPALYCCFYALVQLRGGSKANSGHFDLHLRKHTILPILSISAKWSRRELRKGHPATHAAQHKSRETDRQKKKKKRDIIIIQKRADKQRNTHLVRRKYWSWSWSWWWRRWRRGGRQRPAWGRCRSALLRWGSPKTTVRKQRVPVLSYDMLRHIYSL